MDRIQVATSWLANAGTHSNAETLLPRFWREFYFELGCWKRSLGPEVDAGEVMVVKARITRRFEFSMR